MPPLFLGCYWSDPFFWNEIWHWHIGFRWAIVALWATCFFFCHKNLNRVEGRSWLRLWLRHLMTKPTKWHVHPAKTQISLGICPGWSESLLCTERVAKDPSFLHADSEDSDQTGGMPRLIWDLAGYTCHFVGFVMRRLSSINDLQQFFADSVKKENVP